MSVDTLTNDERTIKWIDQGHDDGMLFKVGAQEVTKITTLTEDGPGVYIPYLIVWRGDSIYARCPAWQYTVCYE